MDTNYAHQVGRNLYLVFVMLALFAINEASNGALVFELGRLSRQLMSLIGM